MLVPDVEVAHQQPLLRLQQPGVQARPASEPEASLAPAASPGEIRTAVHGRRASPKEWVIQSFTRKLAHGWCPIGFDKYPVNWHADNALMLLAEKGLLR